MSEIPTVEVPARPGKNCLMEGGSGLRVLLADANPVSRVAREQQLLAAGHHVLLARTAFEAIVKASCQIPDLILLDTGLVDINATETGQLLMTCPVTAHIPVVRLTPGRLVPHRMVSALRPRRP